MAEKGKDGKGRKDFLTDMKEYFNSWAKNPKKMAMEDGPKIAAGAGISIAALWMLPFVGPTVAATLLGGAIGSRPLRGRTGDAVLKLAGEFETTRKLLPAPPKSSGQAKKGPGNNDKGPGR